MFNLIIKDSLAAKNVLTSSKEHYNKKREFVHSADMFNA